MPPETIHDHSINDLRALDARRVLDRETVFQRVREELAAEGLGFLTEIDARTIAALHAAQDLARFSEGCLQGGIWTVPGARS